MIRFFANSLVVSWLNSIMGLVGFLFVLPVASYYLTAPQFTVWLFGNSIIAIGILFETSVSVVFTRLLTGYLQNKSFLTGTGQFHTVSVKLAGFVSSSFALYTTVSLIGAALAWLAGWFSIKSLIEIGLDETEAYSTLLAFAAVAGSSIILSYGRSTLIAMQQMHTQRLYMLASTIGKLIISVLVIAYLQRVDVTMTAIAVLNLVESIIVIFLSWSVHRLGLGARPNLVHLDEFFIPFFKTLVIRIGGYLTMYSSAVIIVRYAPQDADSYLLSLRLAQAGASVSMIPVSISLPALTRMRVRIKAGHRPVSDFTIEALRVIFFGVTCMILLLGAFVVFGPSVIDFATSDKELLPTAALAYLALIFFLEGHHQAHAMVYETQNRIPYFLVIIVSGITILILSLLVVPHFGIWGALVSINIVQMAANNWVPVWLNLREWGLSWSSYIFRAFHMVPRPAPAKLLNPDS